MPKYIVLVPTTDEESWKTATAEEKQRFYDSDLAFGRLLEERGGKITGGAELSASADARTVRRGAAGEAVATDGPYAEAVEQLSGFYLVECDDLDVLTGCVAPMVEVHGVVEIRPIVAGG